MALNKGYSYTETLNSRAIGHNTLSYLSQFYKHSSEAKWAQRIATRCVTLDDVVASGEELLRAGQVLSWHRPPWQEEATPQAYELVYEDADLLAVSKPSGLPTVPGGGFLENTLLNIVRRDFPNVNPLHRLGRATTGLVLFSRNAETGQAINKNWQHDVKKVYRALSTGEAANESYEINASIGRVEHPKLPYVFAAKAAAKASKSIASVLERREQQTLFTVEIITGRPHQIRIHLAYVGHPLVGDPLYTKGGIPLKENPGLPGDGGYFLHAEHLSLKHPKKGNKLELHSPPPPILTTNH